LLDHSESAFFPRFCEPPRLAGSSKRSPSWGPVHDTWECIVGHGLTHQHFQLVPHICDDQDVALKTKFQDALGVPVALGVALGGVALGGVALGGVALQ
jgi:hypothetical protein